MYKPIGIAASLAALIGVAGELRAQHLGAGRHTCGIPVGTKGLHLSLESSGPAHDAAMIAMAADIRKDAEDISRLHARGLGLSVLGPAIKAAFVPRHHSLLLFVRGADAYFCGSHVCLFDMFTFVNGKWIGGPQIVTDFGDDFYLYNSDSSYPDISAYPAIEEAASVSRFDAALRRYDECSLEARITMKFSGAGRFVVPASINGAIALDFTVDSGADDVAVPADVVLTLMRAGTIKDTDFLGTETMTLADGSQVPSVRFVLRSLQIGDLVVERVEASVVPASGTLLLGRSFLERFKSWSIDNISHELVLR
jgi:clan AA aspartic protease (TIGR02281 family)